MKVTLCIVLHCIAIYRSSYKNSEGDLDDVYSEPDHPAALPSKPEIQPSTDADIYSEIADIPGPQGFFNPMYTCQSDLQDEDTLPQQPASSPYDKLSPPINSKIVPAAASELYSTVEDTATHTSADDYEEMNSISHHIPVDSEQQYSALC